MVIENGHKAGAWVGMCGEMAGMPDLIPVLVGFGLREFSMAPTSILKARKVIRATNFEKSKALSKRILEASNSNEVKSFINNE
jgi:phosphotransferase system enzyme I (PtsI)